MSESKLYRRVKWVEFPRIDKGDYIRNPFCGFYKIYRFDLSEDVVYNNCSDAAVSYGIDSTQALALVEINLKAYKDVELPPKAIENVERIFNLFRHLNMQMIVRFLYDWDGVCIQTEPKMTETIIGHMEQLSAILKKFSADIYIIQGLFVGNWGEMHGGKFTNPSSLFRLYSVLKNCVDVNTFLAVRSPALWRTILRSYTPPESWNDTGLIMLGLYNDGMMASDTDYGTYGKVHKGEAKSLEDKLYREHEIEFQNQLCRFVPNGGEVVNPCRFNDFNEANETLKTMRVSYLNSEYDKDVLRKWQSVTLSDSYGPWKGKTGYDYIACHLGYRFLIESVEIYENRLVGGQLHIAFKLNNVGYSCCYRRLNVFLAVWGDNSSEKREAEIGVDSRLCQPNVPIALSCDIDASGFEQQKIRIAVRLTDQVSGKHIRIANSFLSEDRLGYSMLGVYTKKKVISE